MSAGIWRVRQTCRLGAHARHVALTVEARAVWMLQETNLVLSGKQIPKGSQKVPALQFRDFWVQQRLDAMAFWCDPEKSGHLDPMTL